MSGIAMSRFCCSAIVGMIGWRHVIRGQHCLLTKGQDPDSVTRMSSFHRCANETWNAAISDHHLEAYQ